VRKRVVNFHVKHFEFVQKRVAPHRGGVLVQPHASANRLDEQIY
jgi:hypothetical protein